MNSHASLALIVPNVNPGGTERVCQRIANYLNDAGYSVVVISMANNDFPYDLECSYEKLDRGKAGNWPQRFYSRMTALNSVLESYQVSAVLSMGEYVNFLVSCLPRKYHRINRYTNSSVSLAGFRGQLTKLAMRFAFQRTDATIVPVFRLAAELGLNPVRGKVIEMPNPVDVGEIRRMGLHEPKDAEVSAVPFFLHVGQLVEQKDHDFLLHAYESYTKTGGKSRLLLIGQGEYEQKIRDIVKALNLDDMVFLLGWDENPLAYMHRARALLLTSKWEGIPNVMIESMALGCPVISTDCPTGPREVLDSGNFGRLVPMNDLAAFVDEMSRMDTDEVWRDEWVRRARERADYFDMVTLGPKLCEILSVQHMN